MNHLDSQKKKVVRWSRNVSTIHEIPARRTTRAARLGYIKIPQTRSSSRVDPEKLRVLQHAAILRPILERLTHMNTARKYGQAWRARSSS